MSPPEQAQSAVWWMRQGGQVVLCLSSEEAL
jgi:hypothetical protein